MASFDTLQERLAALQETTGQLKELIDRLANIKFQPGSVPLSNTDEDNVVTELSTEISQTLREEEEDLELLYEEIIDMRSGRPGSDAEHRKTRLKEGVQRLETELKDCRTAFRRAQLSARRSLEAAQKQERTLLLASYAASAASTSVTTTPQNRSGATSPSHQDPPNNQHPPQDPRSQLFTPRDRRRLRSKNHTNPHSDVLTTSTDVTLSLRRTHALIAGELAKSAFATQTLAESSAALAELQRSYEGLDGLLTRSRELVGTLLTAQKSDTWYLQTALRMLLATLVWLVFRRFLYGPLWWLVWLPMRTGWRVGKGVSSGLGGSQSTASVGKMEVVGPEGKGTRVVGIGEEGAVPTVLVGKEKQTVERDGEGEEESMVEKAGRMVEDTLNAKEEEEKNRTAEDEVGDQPNPMKRMWEEEKEKVGVEEQVRDEL